MSINLLGLAQQFLGGTTGSNAPVQGGGVASLIGIAMSFIQSQPGGLMGLVQQFENSGLAAQVQSWVSTGQNQPVNATQIQQAIKPDQMTQMAQQSGMPHSEVANLLATFLPQIVDHLTPNGNVPHDAAVNDSLGALKKLLAGLDTSAQAPQSMAS